MVVLPTPPLRLIIAVVLICFSLLFFALLCDFLLALIAIVLVLVVVVAIRALTPEPTYTAERRDPRRRFTKAEHAFIAKRAGLPTDDVLAAISKGAAQSWQMENRYKTMNQGKFDFGFAVDWMRKDLGICLGEAERNGAELPVTALVDGYYAEVQAAGGGRWDTSSLIKRL